MKKILALVLVAIMCLSLYACGDDERNDDDSRPLDTAVAGGNAGTDTDWLVRNDTINVAKLRECVEIVELTTENWSEHFKVYTYSYTEEKVEIDAFGEIVSTETITHEGRAFGAGNERYHWYDSVAIELKNKATGELSIYEFNQYGEVNDLNVDEDFNLENYECTRIRGSIYYINVSVGDLPVDICLCPVFPNAAIMQPGTLYVYPETNAISNGYFKDWLS